MDDIKEKSVDNLSEKMDGFLEHIKNEKKLGMREVVIIVCALLPIIASSFGFVYYNVITTKTKLKIELREIKSDICDIQDEASKVDDLSDRMIKVEEKLSNLKERIEG